MSYSTLLAWREKTYNISPKGTFFSTRFLLVLLSFDCSSLYCIIDFNQYCSIMMMHNDLDHVSHTNTHNTQTHTILWVYAESTGSRMYFLSDFSTSINFICRFGFEGCNRYVQQIAINRYLLVLCCVTLFGCLFIWNGSRWNHHHHAMHCIINISASLHCYSSKRRLTSNGCIFFFFCSLFARHSFAILCISPIDWCDAFRM